MNRHRHILVVISSFLLLLASCSKPDYRDSVLINTNDRTDVNTLFHSLRSTPEVFTVTAGTYSEVRLSKGTRFRFYPHSFKDNSGNILTSGTVRLSVIEMYSTGSALANRSVGLSGNQLLNNTGQVYVTATMDGVEIGVTKYGIDFYSPVHSGMPMGLYYGVTDYSDSLVRWMRVGNTAGTAVNATTLDSMSVVVIDTLGTGVGTVNIYRNYNQFDSCGALHWVSSQYPATVTTGLTDISVIPADTLFNSSNTAVFVVFPDYHMAVPVSNYDSHTHIFSMAVGYNIPLESRIDVVTIGHKNGLLYYSSQNNVTLTQGMVFSPVMTAHTVTEVLNLLATL